MIEGSCHCGNVSFSITSEPNWLTRCNCSSCRRYGALWAHVETANVSMNASEDATLAYSHGDKNLAFHTCRNCGGTTHWSPLKSDDNPVMAVNFSMCPPEVVARFLIRDFDGADSWKFLD